MRGCLRELGREGLKGESWVGRISGSGRLEPNEAGGGEENSRQYTALLRQRSKTYYWLLLGPIPGLTVN